MKVNENIPRDEALLSELWLRFKQGDGEAFDQILLYAIANFLITPLALPKTMSLLKIAYKICFSKCGRIVKD
jgi:hypothetical protein